MMMILRYLKLPGKLILLCFLFYGCFQSDYTKLVKSELAKGVRQDSLLFGIRLGDSRNDFYGKCFDLNKKGLITQGSGGVWVQYFIKDSLVRNDTSAIRLLFYPTFDNKDIISE